MTLFGIIWSLIILYCYKKRDIKYMLFFTLLFMTFQCENVLYLSGNSGVGPQVLTSICFIIKFVFNSRFKLSRLQSDKTRVCIIALLAIAVVIYISGVNNNNFTDNILMTLQLYIYIITFICIRRTVKKLNYDDLYKIVRSIILFVVVIGFIQWGITMFISPAKILLKFVFYNDNGDSIYFNYNDFYHNSRIYSTFMEPSYMAAFSVGAFYYLLCFWNKIRDNFFLLLSLITIILVSLSSTAYGAFAITGLIFIISSKELKTKWKIFIVVISAFSIIVLFSMFYSVLDVVIFSKATSSSGVTRIRMNNEAYDAFVTSPIFGVGYKAIRGSSIFYTILGQLGIVGLMLFILFNFCSFWRGIIRLFNSEKYLAGYFGAMYAVFASFVCLLIACPDLDLCSYWLWLYILSCYNGLELIQYKKRKIVKLY